MKKAICLIAAFLLFGNIAANALDIDKAEIVVDSSEKTLNIKYLGDNEPVSVLVYDVTDVSDANIDTSFIDEKITPIRGIDVDLMSGGFKVYLPQSLNGKLIIQLSSQNSSPVRLLLEVADGIPERIESAYDAKNLRMILAPTEKIEILPNGSIMNALINATKGSVVTGSTVLSGKIGFNEKGEIYASADSVLKMTAPANDGKVNYGFLKKTAVSEGESEKTFTFEVSGKEPVTKTITFDPIYRGDVQFGFIWQNVPEDVTITLK